MSEVSTTSVLSAPALTALVTRPAGQAEPLLAALREAGVDALEFPLLEIRPVSDPHDLHAALAGLERYALVIFVSPNAIDQALAYREAAGLIWPVQVPLGVVGPGSVRALAQWGVSAPRYQVIAPAGALAEAGAIEAGTSRVGGISGISSEAGALDSDPRYDSEALLDALDQAVQLDQLVGREVLLVRGNGGRELLADTLRAMGVNVTAVTAYQRSMPNVSAARWQDLTQRLARGPEQLVWIFTSSEGVRHLIEAARVALAPADYAALLRSHALAPHSRIAETARSLGFDTITVSGAGDRNIVGAFLSLAAAQPTEGVSRRMTDTHDSSHASHASTDTPAPNAASTDTAAAPGATAADLERDDTASRASAPDASASTVAGMPRQGSGAIALLWAALLIVLLAAAAGAYVLNRKLERTEQALARRADADDVRLTQALAQTHQLDTQLTTQLGQINGRVEDNQTAQQALQQQFQDLARNRDDWTLAEIGQMLSTASEQLQLTGNVQLALFALQSADARLATSSGPQMLSVRRAIEQDIERMKAAPTVDLAGMAIKLDDAIAQVDTLPLAGEAAPPASASQAASSLPSSDSSAQGWRTWATAFLAQAGHDLKSLIQIRRIDDPDAMLVAPDQGYYLRANLKLRLLSARLSLLARNQVTLTSDLNSANQALARYFDPTSKRVQTVRGLLQQVGQASASVELPNMNASLAAVRQFKSRS